MIYYTEYSKLRCGQKYFAFMKHLKYDMFLITMNLACSQKELRTTMWSLYKIQRELKLHLRIKLSNHKITESKILPLKFKCVEGTRTMLANLVDWVVVEGTRTTHNTYHEFLNTEGTRTTQKRKHRSRRDYRMI